MLFRVGSLRPALMISLFLCIVGLCWSALALAAQPDPSLPGNHLVIKEVEVVVDDTSTPPTTLTIKGEAFSFVNLSNLVVTLGEIGPLVIVDAMETEIVATYFEALSPGEYLLSVFTGGGQSKHDEFDLTIGGAGTEGPIGPAGPDGADGQAGANGQDGADGLAGTDGQDGADGAAGPAGVDGAVGPAGLAGPVGLTGPQGSDGQTGPMGFQGPMGLQGSEGPEGPQGEPGTGGVGTLFIQENAEELTVIGNVQTGRISCNGKGQVLSAGIEDLPEFTFINTLTVDLDTNEAVINIVLEPQEDPPIVVGKAICGSIIP